jgi:hypothetical protein
MRGHRTILPAALVLAALAAPAPAAAARAGTEAKACRKACTATQRTCVRDLEATRAPARAACTGTKSEARVCRREAKRIFRAGRRVCRDARRACRRCCRTPSPACAVVPELPVYSGGFPVPERAPLLAPPLPPAPGGRGFALLTLPDGALAWDPADRTPLSAAAECASVMLACVAPPARNFAGCLASVPRCRSRTPWRDDGPMCCPAACAARYQALRQQGLGGAHAFTAAIWGPASCMPEVSGAP